MADETLQQPIAQPAIPAQPMQIKKFNTDTVTLKSSELYGRMKPFSGNGRDYKSTSMAGEQYYLYRYAGTIITVPTAFHLAFEAKEITEVTITGTTRPVTSADPNSPGGTKTEEVQSYGVDSWMTTEDELGLLRIDRHRKQVEQAKKAIQKIDVTKELTPEELEKLIG